MRRRRGWCVVFVAVLGWVALGTAGSAPALPAVDSSGTVIRSPDPVPGEYIVTLRSRSPDVVAPTVAGLTDRHGGQVLDVYTEALQGYAVATTARQAEELAADPAVASVEQNGYVSASDITSPQSPTPSWGLDRVDQHGTAGDNSYSWNADGAGVTAYVIDSGINTSLADFGGRASVGFDGVTPSTGGQDCAGHGTHVAGTIGGATYGVAKKVSLVSVRVLDCTGKGSFDQVIAGVNWVTANAVKPAVANMSLGGAPSTALDTAVANSIASGITYSIAAGNQGTDACTSSPARVPTALTVGATDITDARASFSDYGSCVDLFAPGVNIVSDWFASPFTQTVSGTSMASPHVAGVAARYLASCPSATVGDVTNAVLANATSGTVGAAGVGSPNLLLYSGFTSGDAGASVLAPCAPSAAAVGGNHVVHLSWTLNAAGAPATSLNIYRGTAPGAEGSTPFAANLTPGTTSFDDTSAQNGTTYYYQVAAVNGSGEARSAEVAALAASPPSAPTLNVPTAGNGTVHLSWTAPASNGGSPITQYKVFRGTSPGGEGTSSIATVGSATTSYDDATVTNGITYYYQVAAVNSAGETRSAERSASPIGPPVAPVVTPSPHLTSIDLSWPVPASGGSPVTSYRVYRGTSPGGELATPISPANYTPTTFSDTTVTQGVTYYYQVTAVDSASRESARSSEVGTVAGATIDVFNQTGVAAEMTAQRVTGSSAAPPVSLGAVGTGAPTATADSSGTAVFARGTDGALWWRRILPSGPTPWSSLGGGIIGDPVPVTTSSGIDVFVRGLDSSVYWKHITGTVASPTPVGGYSALGGVATSPPAVATLGTTKYVFVRGGDGSVYEQVVDNNPTSWRSLGGFISSNPAAARDAVGTGGVTVFARGGDLSMYRQHVAADGTPAGWSALGGGITSNPGTTFDGTNTYVFARGGDGGVYYQKLPPAAPASGWIALGGYTSSDPHPVYDGTRVRVVVRGGDNNLYWQAPGFVGWTGLTAAGLSEPAVTNVP